MERGGGSDDVRWVEGVQGGNVMGVGCKALGWVVEGMWGCGC